MSVGTSYDYGKIEIANFVKDMVPIGASILDVGAGGGTYGYYLGVGYNLEAVEIWQESIDQLTSLPWYTAVHKSDIREFKYEHDYDLIIFGDVLEHLTVEDAQKAISEAEKHAKHVLIGIPYRYEQGELYGNEAEIHLQPDLTHELFKQRYPGYRLVLGRFDLYGYYYKKL